MPYQLDVNGSERRARVQSRLRRMTQGALLAATGVTALIAVVVTREHPGSGALASSDSTPTTSSGATSSATHGSTSSTSGSSTTSTNVGSSNSTTTTPSSTSSTPTVTSGGTSR